MRIAAVLALGFALTCHAQALAQTVPPALTPVPPSTPAPIPITEWPLAKISAMGQEIYRQDVAAWVATDALMARFDGTPPASLRGWIVVPDGEHQRVRFVSIDGETVRPGWDVVVRDGRAGAVEVVENGALSAEELARFRARQTAAANIGRLRCGRNMNSVVADDPDSDGWLVWLLTSTTNANIVPVGGHYRFTISADGMTVVSRDQLSNSCLAMEKPTPSDGDQLAGLGVNQIVSQTPVETHVFLSLQNRLPIYVAAGDKVFEVDGAAIREIRQ